VLVSCRTSDSKSYSLSGILKGCLALQAFGSGALGMVSNFTSSCCMSR
jgi:hypothetical protein